MTRRATHLVLATGASLTIAALWSCSPLPVRNDAGIAPTPVESPAPSGAAPLVLNSEPWTYDNFPGTVTTTAWFRIYSTSTRGSVRDRLPRFLETAIGHYRTAIAPLGPPPEQMEVYVMGSRPQWERLTQRLMGPEASTYTQIPRGGFTSRKRSILWDMGPRDTLTITAHEGWHLYTQNTFADPLPVALEEGIATYMEGFRRGEDGTPVFNPWSNFERFMELRRVVNDGGLVPLADLLRSAPQDLMARDNGGDAALRYYAQVWALTHFLVEGDGGKHKAALQRMLLDAQNGRLSDAVSRSMGQRAARLHAVRRKGVDVLAVYTGVPSDSLDAAYRDFVRDVVRVGAGEFIRRGQSPVSSTADAAK
ncbi:MAG TPA: hypothetical protein VD971_00865 [Phycisphaerales bacterium]|nr:hypothetical protein [Phycisphaerales bacterium]